MWMSGSTVSVLLAGHVQNQLIFATESEPNSHNDDDTLAQVEGHVLSPIENSIRNGRNLSTYKYRRRIAYPHAISCHIILVSYRWDLA